MTDKARLREIRAKLDAIAPLPENGPVTAKQLARYMAVRANERWHRQLSGAAELDHQQLAAICAEYAAAVAIEILGGHSATVGDAVATMIRDALDDGQTIGEWLWTYLGDATAVQVSDLCRDLETATACTTCEDGLVEISACNCAGGTPESSYLHEAHCGTEPCPNGCWERLHPPASRKPVPAT